MNEKDNLYEAIKVFSDGDEDVYDCLKRDLYTLTHTDDPFKFRRTVAMILFFTNHDKNITNAINLYIKSKNIDKDVTVNV